MITTTPSHTELLDAIEHLPPGGVLSFEGVAWREYEKLLEALGIESFNEVKRKFRKWVQENKHNK